MEPPTKASDSGLDLRTSASLTPSTLAKSRAVQSVSGARFRAARVCSRVARRLALSSRLRSRRSMVRCQPSRDTTQVDCHRFQ